MSSELSPETDTRLRVKFDIEYEFLAERNLFDADEEVGHDEIREAISHLAPHEKKVLEKRLEKRLRELESIMNGERKTFDEPYVRHEDLLDGIRIPGYWDHQ